MGNRVCVVEFPPAKHEHGIHLTQFLSILTHLSENVSLVSGSVGYWGNPKVSTFLVRDGNMKRSTLFQRVLRYIRLQFGLGVNVIRAFRHYDLMISFHDYVNNFIPLLVSKIMGKKVGIYIGGSPTKNIEKGFSGILSALFSSVSKIIEKLIFSLSDVLIPLSRSMIQFQQLNRYENKVSSIDGARYVNHELFSGGEPTSSRSNTLTYIGRLSHEKGVLELLASLSDIVELGFSDVLIVGDGDLMEQVDTAASQSLAVQALGQVTHSDIPTILRKTKILLLPSFTEGLPTIVIEAMAAGAIVVATDVGGVSDLIQNATTGFLMSNNNPETIIRTLRTVLESEKLDNIQKSARLHIEENYSFEGALQRWKMILTLPAVIPSTGISNKLI